MAVSFDGDNLRIILDANDPEVDVEADLYSEWKEWMKTGDNAKYPLAFRTVGGDPLTPGIDAGAYFFIRNDLGWRVRPAEADQTYYVVGNLAPQDSSLPILVPTTGNFSVLVSGLQPVTQSVSGLLTLLQFSSFNGGVAIDLVDGVSGTEFPIGTELQPVDNLTDALTIANTRGFTKFYINSDITIASGNYEDHIFIGQTPSRTLITVQAAANVDGVEFLDTEVTGTLDGMARLIGCKVSDLNYINGVIDRCLLTGTTTLGGTNVAYFLDCWTGEPGSAEATINLGGASGPDCVIRNMNGWLKLTNGSNASAVVTLDFNSGVLELDSTMTACTVIVRGLAQLIDNSNGATIINETLDPVEYRKVRLNKQITDPDTNKLIIYDDDDSTPYKQADIYEDKAGTTPYTSTSKKIERRDKLQ